MSYKKMSWKICRCYKNAPESMSYIVNFVRNECVWIYATNVYWYEWMIHLYLSTPYTHYVQLAFRMMMMTVILIPRSDVCKIVFCEVRIKYSSAMYKKIIKLSSSFVEVIIVQSRYKQTTLKYTWFN